MDLGLDSKRALVTGSTAGIGFAIAEALAAEGASVTLNGRTQARVDAAVEQLRAKKPRGKVEGIAADLGTEAGAKELLAKLPEVDVLVNNLGIFEPKPFLEIPDDDWRRFFEVNVLSGVRLSRAYLPKMLAKNWGRILFVSSESGIQIPAEMIHYGTTKTAQIAVARGIAESVAGTGVTVNSVLPGPTKSEGVGGFVEDLARSQSKDVKTVEADFFPTCDRARSSSGSRPSTRSPRSSCTSRASEPPRRLARPSASTAASFARLPETWISRDPDCGRRASIADRVTTASMPAENCSLATVVSHATRGTSAAGKRTGEALHEEPGGHRLGVRRPTHRPDAGADHAAHVPRVR